MLKTTLKVATVLALLSGCYAGYVRAFAAVINHLESNRKGTDAAFIRKMSKSKKESIERARAFGPGHWTSEEGTTCYIGTDFWLYFKRETQPEKQEGKRIVLEPVALVVLTDGGKSTVTITADEGTFDFNQRPGLSSKKNAEPFKVLKAQLSRNVMLRHDRGTPGNPGDDLFVGPLTYADYDEQKLQIKSKSPVLIRDLDTTITGEEFLIQLRPKEEPAGPATAGKRGNGFDGIQTAMLMRNVHVVSRDVGQTGFLPSAGNAKKGQGAPGEQTVKVTATRTANPEPADPGQAPPAETKPLDVTSTGPMKVSFPEPRVAVRVGPPAPPLPTIIEFTRDVLAQVGKLDQWPDQLSCDTLELTLYPSEPPPGPAADEASKVAASPDPAGSSRTPADGESKDPSSASAEAEPAAGKAFGDLALRDLKATGYAVWVRLSQQTTTIQGVELKHHKAKPGQLDVTYMRGRNAKHSLIIEKLDVNPEDPTRKVLGVTNVWATDATIYDDGGDTDNATVIIRGPGRLETRAERNQPPQRIAEWRDRLEVKEDPASAPAPAAPLKLITLTGVPFVRDLSRPDAPSSLDASDRIIFRLKPKPADPLAPAKARSSGAPLSPDSSGYEIEQLIAFEDAHLISPGQNITARKRLDAQFQPPPASTPAAPATATAVVATNVEPAAAPPQDGEPAAAPERPKLPPERKIDADTVWASVQLLPAPAKGPATLGAPTKSASGGPPATEYEVREVKLHRRVVFHQDPEEGKARGNDAIGEALYLYNEGKDKVRMVVLNDIPKTTYTKEGVAQNVWSTPDHLKGNLKPARISTDEMQISGPIIGMDQTKDFAYVNGPGTLTQLVDRGMMANKSPLDPAAPASGDPAAPGAADPKRRELKVETRAGKPLSEKTELTISWKDRMQFFGRSPDYNGRPDSAARAEFYGDVHAITQEQDSLLDCKEKMITYTDRPVPLTKVASASTSRTDAKQPPSPRPTSR